MGPAKTRFAVFVRMLRGFPRFCEWHGKSCASPLLKLRVDFAAQANLIVAMSDLKVVRLLRDAIRTTALAAGGVPGPLGTVINPKHVGGSSGASGSRLHASDQLAPRQVFHPTPRYEPRPVYHPTPRIEPCPPPILVPLEPECPFRVESPIKPPWRIPLWQIPPQPVPQIKVIQHRTDVKHKGSLIDIFI